ncbi:unnamed protein product [Owenia fusiformis]|uniref:NADH dehydrogenase [ubiquinone] 1 beta subcomplex subunit 5, mitochondrial n=1 Tax=Owenia fusiformis TaxID=6347 RepID=A0A8S4MZB4_OWEFU|nr:unnamed protein product [Owenia fusiformis]
MAVLSLLRAARPSLLKCLQPHTKAQPSTLFRSQNNALVPVRHGHGPSKLQIKPSKQDWTVFKDQLHYYIMLGAIPLGLLITYVNIFIGPAQLRDIPEGYEPKHWEYHKHPISRWFARYVYDSPEKEYEKALHFIHMDAEKRKYRLLEKEVRYLMGKRGDSKGWYYVPINERRIHRAIEDHDDNYATLSK